MDNLSWGCSLPRCRRIPCPLDKLVLWLAANHTTVRGDRLLSAGRLWSDDRRRWRLFTYTIAAAALQARRHLCPQLVINVADLVTWPRRWCDFLTDETMISSSSTCAPVSVCICLCLCASLSRSIWRHVFCDYKNVGHTAQTNPSSRTLRTSYKSACDYEYNPTVRLHSHWHKYKSGYCTTTSLVPWDKLLRYTLVISPNF